MLTEQASTTFRPLTQPTPPGPSTISGPDLRGRARALVVCAVGGLAWANSAPVAQSSRLIVPVRVASAVIALALLLAAGRLRHAAAGLASSLPDGRWNKIQTQFYWVVAAELSAIVVTVGILAGSRHEEWIPAAICAVVGLHFLPLARIFTMPIYYATALALSIVALATVILAVGGAPESVWHVVPGLGAAVSLWVTGASVLVLQVPVRQGAPQWR